MIHELASIDDGVILGKNVQVWEYARIRSGAVVGENSIIGRNVYVGPGVVIGKNCKIQNNALIYEPAIIGDGVFIGPAAVLTNDKYPRATNGDSGLKSAEDWDPVGVVVSEGASIGANAVCVAPVNLGNNSMVGAQSVVTKDVEAKATVVGNPARGI